MRSRRLRLGAAIATALTLTLVACSPSEPDRNGPTDAPTAGGEVSFVSAVPGVAEDLDGGIHRGDPTRWLNFERAGTLVAYDPAGLEGAGCSQLADVTALKGELAESWEVSEDRRTIRFTLKDLTSRYGNPLTSEDVRWTFERTVGLEDFASSLLTSIARYDAAEPVTVIDEKTFELNVVDPGAVDLAALTWYALAIIDSTEASKHTTADDPWASEWLRANDAHFGPWNADPARFTPGEQVVLTRNDGFADAETNIDTFLLRSVPESATRMQLLETGEVDNARRLTYQQYQDLQSRDSVQVVQCNSADRDVIVLNQQDERFADVRVRQAISLAVDREELVTGAYLGFAKPAVSGLNQAYGYEVLPGTGYELDVDAARALLAEAGYPEGFSFRLSYSPSRPGPESERMAILLKSQLEKIGIEVTLDLVPGATEFNDLFFSKSYEAMIYMEPPAIADPYYSMMLYNASTSFQNTHSYASAEYDELVERVRTLQPGPERDQVIAEAAAFIASDHPFIYLTDRESIQAFSSRITGYVHYPNGEIQVKNLTKE